MTDKILLPVAEATPENVAPFGHLIGSASGAELMPLDYYKGAVRVSRPAPFSSEHPVELSLASVDPRAPEVRYMERHFQHTQAFISFAGKSFVVVMAPPGTEDLPDLSKACALRFDGSAGFLMHVGTWHEFPFALEPDTDIVVILSDQTTRDLRNKQPDTEEAFGPDLDKKDIAARTGKLLCFAADG
ncbi:ureidoglycolate lyase [Parasphingorhabdus marina DSM 22363]|uniref:Ureidoglycolate lyase n=1 Tax=Parasphingorhabdus marina DSM 22363 TaxID=1123272 RepID=A0A1N6CSV0_9SPHN|nr:ureidoglycolate lyase [Parasphingorhabdus marina]SIN61546.1 ureidoglycolate lyase [Parasphingorhabdus marina DSM 22363]